MLEEGVEPSPTYVEGILSPQCLPFHHPSKNEVTKLIVFALTVKLKESNDDFCKTTHACFCPKG